MTFGSVGAGDGGDGGESPEQDVGGESETGSTPDGGDGVPDAASNGGETAIVDGSEEGDKLWHLTWNGDPDTGGCPHCPKNSEHERHKQGCPVRRKRRYKRRDRIGLVKRLLGLK